MSVRLKLFLPLKNKICISATMQYLINVSCFVNVPLANAIEIYLYLYCDDILLWTLGVLLTFLQKVGHFGDFLSSEAMFFREL